MSSEPKTESGNQISNGELSDAELNNLTGSSTRSAADRFFRVAFVGNCYSGRSRRRLAAAHQTAGAHRVPLATFPSLINLIQNVNWRSVLEARIAKNRYDGCFGC